MRGTKNRTGFRFRLGNMENVNNEELYDRICEVLTWYEHPEEYPCGEDNFNRHIAEEMYNILVRVQNELF